MPDSRPAWITHDQGFSHRPGPDHPESPDRLETLHRLADTAPWSAAIQRVTATPATRADLERVHHPVLIDTIQREIREGRPCLSTGDTPVGPGSWEAALAAAGAGITAVDGIAEGRWKRAFCAVRPPGHHATPARSMGFCIVNNIAVTARYALERLNLERVAILDWDVHHGNGTQDAFYDDPRVFFAGVHQHPWYPGTGFAEETGEGPGRGTTLNLPLPAGSGGAEILGGWRNVIRPALDAYRPELILISAGFDAMAGDPLGGFALTSDDFRTWTRELAACSERHAEGRMISLLEGGYDLDLLAAGVSAHLEALCEPALQAGGTP